MGRPSDNLRRLFVAGLTLVAGFGRPSRARAVDSPPEGRRLAGDGCPRATDVLAELGQVLAALPAHMSADDIVIHDRGSTWDIEVRGRHASYDDARHNCAERLRVATVFAALAVEPADEQAREPAAPPAQPPSTPPHVARYAIELAPLLGLAPVQARDSMTGLGVHARLVGVGAPIALSLGAEAATFSKLDLGPYAASMARAVLDVACRLRGAAGPFQLAGELGPYVGVLHVRGAGLAENGSESRLDAGARAAFIARLRGFRLAPFTAVQAALAARQFDLAVDPSGTLAATPRFWLGLLVGAALDL